METIVDILQVLQLNVMEVFAISVAFLVIGYWRGNHRSRKLQMRIYKLENDILELHAEMLYPKEQTPVIEIGNSSDIKKSLAK
ncbi:MAG TPA: hypothetical protein VNV85_15155 [Puia sp.]|jgi:hypothetical protein|nr:hypothetical protein [Puia sp.]